MREEKRDSNIASSARSVRNRVWFFLNIIFTLIYLYWRVFYTLPMEYSIVSRVSGIILITIELIGALEAFIHYWNMYNVKDFPLPEVPLDEFPDVDVFIATYNEPTDILYKTVNGCVHMDYPDKSKVHIYICDDKRRPEIRELAKEMGVNYIDRADNKGAKAGNLNNAMSLTSSPLVATLDADMIPNHNFLMRMVPYFVDAEIKNREREEKDKINIGFVQSPQAFYNPDLYQFYLFSENRIPNEQDYFYKDIQVARNKSNSVIYGGSNTILSRKAIETVGGFYTESITEDFATGILIQKAKFKCIATGEVLASGLSANTIKDLIQQRTRWARGVINTSRKVGFILTDKLTFAQKLNYSASMWYWYSSIKIFVYIMAPIMYATFGYVVIKCTLPQILMFWLPMYISSNITLKMLSGNIRTTKWSKVYETVLFPFLFFPVLLETFGISMKKFKVTQKGEAKSEKGKNYIYSIPFLVFIILSLIGIYNSVKIMFLTASVNPIVILFWLVANLFSLVMALFFIQGRDFVRRAERVRAQVDCEIKDEYETIYCKTTDFSEVGLSAVLENPCFVDDKQEVEIRVWSDRYEARLKAKIIHVIEDDNKWKYAFEITNLPEEYKSDYMQLLYDRIPTMPMTLNESLSSFDDLRINVTNRTKETLYDSRKFARINISDIARTGDSQEVKIVNFNYKYIALDTPLKYEISKVILSNELVLDCAYEKTVRDGVKIYRVENINDIYKDPIKRSILNDWINKNLMDNREEVVKNDEKKEPKEFFEMDDI